MIRGDPASADLDGPKPAASSPRTVGGDAAPAYAELHAHTNFSLLDGTSDPEAMVAQAAALGLRALAITDHDSISGIVRFAAAAKQHRLHAIIGVELTVQAPHGAGPLPDGGAPGRTKRGRGSAGEEDTAADRHVVLLAQDLTGYQNICRLLTRSYERGGKDHPHVPFDVLAQHSAGLVALSACSQV